jgi:predicted small lipoprotein YifL
MKQASWILIVGACVAVVGCGMKGPLYLPDKNASVVTRPGSGNTTTTTPPAQTTPGTTASPAPAPGNATPSTPPKQPQDKSSDDSQSTSSTPPKS